MGSGKTTPDPIYKFAAARSPPLFVLSNERKPMRSQFTLLSGLFFVCAAALSSAVTPPSPQVPGTTAAPALSARAADVPALTIYNQNFAVVRQTFPLDL